MKKIIITFISFTIATSVFAQKLDRSIKPKPGIAPEIVMGEPQSFTLPNGLKVFIVENHKLPVVSCNIQLDIKPALEGEYAGYRNMMSELLLSGTKNRTKDKLNEEIDNIGAKINISSEGMNGSGMKKYMEKIFDLMSDIAINTKIEQKELDNTKKKALSGIETEKNDPDAMVRNVSAVVNYGTNHPYGEIPTEETINKITLEKCVNYYATYFKPNVAYMAIVGDVTMAEVKPLIEKYFGKWEKKEVPITNYTIPALGTTKLTKVAFAPRTAAVQSVVSVTYPIDLKPGTADVIKARVANTVLGGGSQGRLFLDLREKHAWTYGAYSSLREDDLGGSFSATVKCRNIVSDSSIGAILDEMKQMQTDKVTDTGLQNCISYLSGNFAIGMEDPKRIAQYAINIERYHMPKDFYKNFLKNLSMVTPDDVMEMSRKYIRPDNANIVVAGSKDDVAGKLAHFSADGKIDFYDYAGKPLVISDKKAAPSNLTADDVYKKYIAAMGGEKAYNSINDIKTISTTTMQGMALTITEIKKTPGKFKALYDVSMNGKNMNAQTIVFDGTKGYTAASGQHMDMKDDEIAEYKSSSDPAGDLHPEKYGIIRTLKGMEVIDGNDTYVIEAVNAKNSKSTEYYDAKSGLLVRKIQTQDSPQGSVTSTTDYKDYREVPGTNGYKLPYSVTQAGGGPTMTATVQTVEVNKGIADTEFK